MAVWWRSLALPEPYVSALLAESDAQQLRVALVAARVQCERLKGAVLRLTQERAKVRVCEGRGKRKTASEAILKMGISF